jgi:hypothetical protein
MNKLVLLFSTVFLLTSFTVAQNYAKKGTWEFGGSASFTSNSFVVDGESEIGGDPANNVRGFEIPTTTTILFNIAVGYFVVDGLQIGLVPEYLNANVGDESFDVTTSAYGIFFSTSYAFNTGGSVYPFLGGMVGYSAANISLDADTSGLGSLLGGLGGLPKTTGTQTTNTTGSIFDETASGLGWGVTGGIKIQISKGALLSLAVGYHQRTYDPPETISVFGTEIPTGNLDPDGNIVPLDRTGINSFVVSLGFSVFLGK